MGTPGLGYGLLSKDRCKAESVKVTLAVRCILLLLYFFSDKTRSTAGILIYQISDHIHLC